jgi:uncharacterized protein (DUF983 family)
MASSKRSQNEAIVLGLKCRCPSCGKGRLYDGLLSVRENCGECGFDLENEDSGDGPVSFLIFFIGALVVIMAFVVDAKFAPPLWLHAIIWAPVIAGMTISMLRPAKSLMIALQFHHRATQSNEIDYDE